MIHLISDISTWIVVGVAAILIGHRVVLLFDPPRKPRENKHSTGGYRDWTYESWQRDRNRDWLDDDPDAEADARIQDQEG